MTEFEDIRMKAMSLPPRERAELAELLIQSLDEPQDEAVKSAWLDEIHRRDQEIRSGANVTVPADQVVAEARRAVRCIG